MVQDMSYFYFEDAIVGRAIETPSHTVAREDILKFGEATLDKHPLHTDDDYCRQNTSYDGVIGHGLYGVALMEGLKAPLKLYYRTSLASLGWDKIKFLKPILPGDVLRARITFIDARRSSTPGRGVVREKIELLNERDDILTEAEHVTMLLMRPPRGGDEA